MEKWTTIIIRLHIIISDGTYLINNKLKMSKKSNFDKSYASVHDEDFFELEDKILRTPNVNFEFISNGSSRSSIVSY